MDTPRTYTEQEKEIARLRQALDREIKDDIAHSQMLAEEIRILREEGERKDERIAELEDKIVELYERTKKCEQLP